MNSDHPHDRQEGGGWDTIYAVHLMSSDRNLGHSWALWVCRICKKHLCMHSLVDAAIISVEKMLTYLPHTPSADQESHLNATNLSPPLFLCSNQEIMTFVCSSLDLQPDFINQTYLCSCTAFSVIWWSFVKAVVHRDARSSHLRQVAKARRALRCRKWMGKPLKVCPSGTALLTASWNSSLPQETPVHRSSS